jgi:NAD-dependent SIR2 family protein deacetylase
MTYYESVDPGGDLTCEKCDVPLEKREATFHYLGNAFPVELPTCPVCGFILVPESLALGEVLRVEKSLEDK